jgi:DnaJ-class molecular chaperone
MSTDYYKILEIEKTASDSEIKKAFRRLAHKYHPDKGGDEEKFKEINEAYQTLSNKEKRAQYDRFGSSANAFGNAGGFGGTGFGQGGFGRTNSGGFNMNYGNFTRGASGAKVFSFSKLPTWTWIFLIPIVIVIAFIGIVLVFFWIVFSTLKVFTRGFIK